MKALLNNRFVPATFSWGFLEAPFDELFEKIDKWMTGKTPYFKHEIFESDLAGALPKLEPLNLNRVLYIDTDSPWVAVFLGHPSGPDTQVPYLSMAMPCRGLYVDCVENTYDDAANKGMWGGTTFSLHAADPTTTVNQIRTIQVMNNCGKWEFHNHGEYLPFEKPEYYKARRIKDRFTPEMLEEYCLAMGIRLFDEDFYGPRCALFYNSMPVPDDFQPVTYKMEQERIGIP